MKKLLFVVNIYALFSFQCCEEKNQCGKVYYRNTPISDTLRQEFIKNNFTNVIDSLELNFQEESEYYFLSKIAKEELKLKKNRMDSCFNLLISIDSRQGNKLCEIKEFIPELLYIFTNNFNDYTLNEYIDERVLGKISKVFDDLKILKPIGIAFKRESERHKKYKDYSEIYDIGRFVYEDDELKDVLYNHWVKWGLAYHQYLNDKDFLTYESKLSDLAGYSFMSKLMDQHIMQKKKNEFFSSFDRSKKDSIELENMFHDFDSTYSDQCNISKIQFNLYYKELTPDLVDEITLCIKSLNPIDSIIATSCLAQYYLYENEIEKAMEIINTYKPLHDFKFFYQEQEYGIIKSVELEIAFQKKDYDRFKRIMINLKENPEINYYENRSRAFIVEFIFRKYYKYFPSKSDNEIYDMYEKEFASFVANHCIYD